MKKVFYSIMLLVLALVAYYLTGSTVTENLDSHVYELPFRPGAEFTVVQGYGGLFSHRHKAALDFSMPVGTPVYAARGGTIYRFKDDSDEGGPFARYEKKANYIIIQHSDGSFGCYWHLRKGGVAVQTGVVRTGQLIGYSGATGFVLRPHLHFTVKRRLSYAKDAFVRTRFRTNEGVQLLAGGHSYQRSKE
ncbi:MAG: M23 family metallopeptidase [Sphingobacteriales bacterium]|nr:MAG: M23 family metallopeptidase [Sphingobacteriales bacterium]